MSRRGIVLAGIVLALAAFPATAQPPREVPLVAIVEQAVEPSVMVEGGHPWWSAFLHELRRLGYAEGTTVAIERHSGAGQNDEGLAALAQSIVADVPAVIVARGFRLISAFRNATATIPIVGVGTFPGLIDTLATPGRNVTGIDTTAGLDIYMKHLEMLQAAAPIATRVAWLGPEEYWRGPIGRAAKAGADQLGVELVPVFIQTPTGEGTIREAFAKIVADGLPLIQVSASPDMTAFSRLIATLAVEAGLPGVALQREYADAGLLLSFGPDFLALYRQAAGYVDQILRGADPGRMLIQQADKFELIVNLATAEALGLPLPLPASIMIQATEIIE